MQVSDCVHAVTITSMPVSARACVNMVSLTTNSMAESSGGGGTGSPISGNLAGIQQVACIFCRAPLPTPTAPFCTHCGYPQKKCINSRCGGPVPPGAPICPYCWTPQHSQQQGAAKKCINPQCGAVLHPIAGYCTTCNAPQDPVIYQQLMSVPNCVNKSCSTKLLKPDQKICHECGAIQSTQTSVVHGGQQPLPHGSQPSYYSQPSYTHVPNPSLYISQPTHVPQPPPQVPQPPHDPQPSVPPSDSTSQEQILPAGKRSPDSDTSDSTSKRSKIEVEAGLYFMITF